MSTRDEVLQAARSRSAALVARDAETLRALHHPEFRFTTPRGDVRNREEYVTTNTQGGLVWRAQELEQAEVTVVNETAVLIAIAHDAYERDGVPGAHDMRLTLTWIRSVGGAWTALAGHAGPAL